MELKRGQLTTKDMSTLREGEAVRDQITRTSGALREYSLLYHVRMGWGDEYKEPVRKLKPFGLIVDGEEYVLSWAEIEEMGREGFFYGEGEHPKYYQLRFYSGPKVVLDTDLNEDAEHEKIFRLTVDKKELLLDWYQMQRIGRFI